MPELHFLVRWPDGSSSDCRSPSPVIKDFFRPGSTYALEDFMLRSRRAFAIAAEGIRIRRSPEGAHADRQLAEIERTCARFMDRPGARVMVESIIG